MSLTKTVSASILLLAGLTLLLLPQFATSQQMPGMSHDASSEPTPAFHSEAPKDPLPATMQPSLFPTPLVFNAYTLAGRVKKVLYQEPCYCHCDRSVGHGSLLDCFVSQHGSGCGICQREAFYTYEQTQKGKTPAQIREGIIHGEWRTVDVSKYEAANLPVAKASSK